ncbi:MAG TPA: DEAD/DEAH box helicase [Candidatus Paceibacterota bacterium]|jgi:superfamily II DNA/RNA helicase|nr:DEAD/DEAH box helicase [Candidatus Paceibacterota bacterium]
MTTRFKSHAPHRRGHAARASGKRYFGNAQSRSRSPRKASNIDISRFINSAPLAKDAEPFTPTHQFADFAIDPRIKHTIAQKGYITPTPIQDGAIPHILQGRDIVGIADTGTGKTGAFLVPLLDKVVRDRTQRVLIVVPTRELAQQIDEEFKGFSKGSGFRSVCAVGGANISPQIRGMRMDPFFVIGTPGRLKDLLDRRALDLSKFATVVLDEADRMLDMGFIRDVKFILSHMPRKRHTLFFSATLSREIEGLIGDFLSDPVRINAKTGDTAAGVHQDIVRIGAGKTKIDVLHELLTREDFKKVLVFGRTKHGMEKLSKLLKQRGIAADSIHGNKSQSSRQRALASFKNDQLQVLVATDVAARGIDIADVSHVINYDLPTTYEDYVHRIGRTGRAGKRGQALTFVE